MRDVDIKLEQARRNLTRVSNRWLARQATDTELRQAQRAYTLASNAAFAPSSKESK